MNVLLTGASGFIGRNVLLRAPRTWRITAVYHRHSIEGFLRQHELDFVTPVACDLTNPSAVDRLVAATGAVDAVLYLAANGDPAASASRPVWDLQLNTAAPLTLLERLRGGRFVYFSSGAVYDGLVGDVTPATPVSPRLPYAISKLATEHYVRHFAGERRTIDGYVNVRFFGAYGPYEAARKITTRWLRAALDGQRVFTVRGNGENLIDFMHVDDAVDAILRLTGAADFSGTVDLACGAPVTINAILESMARASGADLRIAHEGHTEEYIRFRSADPTLRERFGFTPSVPFDEGIRRLRDFFLKEQRGAGQSA
jgi:nucleoside-diphosphate-sugar epimerase